MPLQRGGGQVLNQEHPKSLITLFCSRSVLHFINFLPTHICQPFALTIPRSRLIEVSFTLETSVSTGPLASDVSVQLPIRIINNISLDPPPAFGPPEKLRNLPPVSNDIPIDSKSNLADTAVKRHQFSRKDSDPETLARPQPSHIFTECGTYRGDGKMPTLGKLVVRNRASVASGTIDGQSASRLSHPQLWGQEIRDPLSSRMDESDNGPIEPASSEGCSGQETSTSHPIKGSSETQSLDEYLQGPRPGECAQIALLSVSLDPMLGIDDCSDEVMEIVMRSVNPNNFDVDEEEEGIWSVQSLNNGTRDETHDRIIALGDTFVPTRDKLPTVSQESFAEENPTTLSSRATSRAGFELSASSTRAFTGSSVPEETLLTQHSDSSQASDPLSSSRAARQFLSPQRPRPHPIFASPIGNMHPPGNFHPISRPKGKTLRDSMDLSNLARTSRPRINPNSQANNPRQKPHGGGRDITERRVAPVNDGPFSQELPQSVPAESNHTKMDSSATVNRIPTTISALMLQNLKTPATVLPPFIPGSQESAIALNGSVSTEANRSGPQKFGSTRMPLPAGASSIRARIAMFEQVQANNIPTSVHSIQPR
jgi:hypothetical protein